MGEKEIKKAMQHRNILGAGVTKRRHLSPGDKIITVMKEFRRGTLHSGSGQIVTNKDQAIAIAISESKKRKK